MSQLSGGYNLGGAVIWLAGDTTRLRASVAEAKMIVADAQRTIVANISFKLDIPRLRSELQAATAGLSIRIPVSLDMNQARQQLAGIGAGGGGGGAMPWGAASPNLSYMLRQQSNDIVGGLQPQASPNWSYLMRQNGGNGGGGGGGGAGGNAGGGGMGMRGFRPMAIAYLAVRAASAIANAALEPGKIASTSRYDGLEAAARETVSLNKGHMGGLEELAWAGFVHAGRFNRGLLGYSQRYKGDDMTYAERLEESEFAVGSIESGKRIESNRNTTRLANQRTGAAGILGRQSIVSKFNIENTNRIYDALKEGREAISNPNTSASEKNAEVKSIQQRSDSEGVRIKSEESAALKKYDDEDKAEIRSTNREITAIKSEAANAQLGLTQGSIAEQKAALKTGLDAEIQAVKDAIQKMKDEGASPSVIGAEQGRLSALQTTAKTRVAVQSGVMAREDKRLATSTAAGAKVYDLMAAGNPRAAHEAQTNATYDARIQAEIDRNGPKSPLLAGIEKERKAALAAASAGNARTDNLSIAASKAGATVAGLHAGRQDFLAETTAFDANAANTLQAMRNAGDPANVIAAKAAEFKAQRGALVAGQSRTRADIVGGLNTRSAVAGAQGMGFGAVAGLLGTIGGMKQELRDTQPEFAGQIKSTQTAELKAFQAEVMRPQNYAASFDIHHDAVGGPSGQSGAEQAAILKIIAGYLQTIAGKDQPTARFN